MVSYLQQNGTAKSRMLKERRIMNCHLLHKEWGVVSMHAMFMNQIVYSVDYSHCWKRELASLIIYTIQLLIKWNCRNSDNFGYSHLIHSICLWRKIMTIPIIMKIQNLKLLKNSLENMHSTLDDCLFLCAHQCQHHQNHPPPTPP